MATAAKLQHIADSLILDDQRCEDIIRSHVNLPPELMTQLQYHDIYLTGEEAVKFGIADEIAEFSPPAGTQVFNILG
jgi:ATP-dependent Clp protease protease subunit